MVATNRGLALFAVWVTAALVYKRKLAEDALRVSETRYRTLYDANPTMYFTAGADGAILSANEFGASYLGYSVDELIGKPLSILFADAFHQHGWDHLGESLSHPDRSHRWEVQLARKNGERFWISETSRVVCDPHGQPNLFIVCEDITERKQTEAALRRSEASLANAQRIARLGNWDCDVTANAIEWSQETYRIFGLKPEEFGGTYEAVLERVHPDDRAFVQAAVEKMLHEKAPCSIDFRIVLPDDQQKSVHCQGEADYDAAGTPTRMSGTIQDITERKKAEEAVRDSEERVRLLLESTGEAIFGVDTGGKITFCNPACSTTLAYDRPDKLLGKKVHDLLRYTRSEGTPGAEEECPLDQALRRGEALEVQDEFLFRADGSSFPVEIRLRPMRREGEIVGAVVTFDDITDRHQREAEVIQASKLATLGELATTVAHELNQPLSVIRMAAERMMESLESGEVDAGLLKERLDRIASQVDRASTVMDHMRIFSRPAETRRTRFDARHTIDGALGLMGEQLRLHDIDVRVERPESCVPVLGDEIQLEQVVLNLLSNARDAIDERFARLPDVAEERVININVECSEAEKRVRIIIRDNGGGIPDAVMSRIFQPFVTTKEPGKGTGLGLSVSYGIVTHIGGTIAARNVEGGAEFTITLPAADPDGESGGENGDG